MTESGEWKRRDKPMFKLVILFFLFSSCALGPANFESHQVADLGARNIRRIAIYPLEPLPVSGKDRADQVRQEKEKNVARLLSQFLYSTMAALPRWQIVSDREVAEALGALRESNGEGRARRLGELVHADAVLSGRMLRYRERVGEDWGAKSPASVAFVLELRDVKRGDLVWRGRFDETQKSLSEDVFAIGEFARRGPRWLKAGELAMEGIKKAVSQLHQTLVGKT